MATCRLLRQNCTKRDFNSPQPHSFMFLRELASAPHKVHDRINPLKEKEVLEMFLKQSMYYAQYLLAHRESSLFPKSKQPPSQIPRLNDPLVPVDDHHLATLE